MTLRFDIDQGDKEAIQRKLSDLRPALSEIGIEMVASAEETFRKQALANKPWLGRSVPNIAGIISDLNRGANPPKRRFEARPAGVDTGKLRQSISLLLTNNSVKAYSRLSYSKKFQEGGQSTHKLTTQGKETLKRFLERNRGMRKTLGFLFKKKVFKITQPARPFLAPTKELENNILEILGDYFGGEL
jgi:phage gpG-like protein